MNDAEDGGNVTLSDDDRAFRGSEFVATSEAIGRRAESVAPTRSRC